MFQVETTTNFYKPMLAIYGFQLENIFGENYIYTKMQFRQFL